MEQNSTKIYNGRSYTFDVGIDENGKAPVRIDYGHVSERQQPQRTIARRVIIELDDDGIPVEVTTKLEHQEFFNDGSIAKGTCYTEDYRMADEELPVFQGRFGLGLRISIYNMFARGGKPGQTIGLGQNQHPPFDFETGAFKPEEVTIPGTFDYPHDKGHATV